MRGPRQIGVVGPGAKPPCRSPQPQKGRLGAWVVPQCLGIPDPGTDPKSRSSLGFSSRLIRGSKRSEGANTFHATRKK